MQLYKLKLQILRTELDVVLDDIVLGDMFQLTLLLEVEE